MDSPSRPISSHQEPVKESQIYWRNLFHIVIGSGIPIIGMLSNSKTMVVLIITLECLRFRYDTLNVSFVCVLAPILKRKEIKTVTGTTYMLISSLVCFPCYSIKRSQLLPCCSFRLETPWPPGSVVKQRSLDSKINLFWAQLQCFLQV